MNKSTPASRVERYHRLIGENGMIRLIPLVAVLAMALGIMPTFAQVQTLSDQAVRVAFVFNLTKYVDWPVEAAHSEFLVGVIGDGSIGQELKQMLDGKKTGDRSIRVVLSPTSRDVEHCSIVYISYSSKSKILSALEKVPKTGVLTVGEADHFTRDGGVIGLVAAGSHIKVQIDAAAAASAQLKISSRLLNIAEVINRPQNGARY